MAKDDSSEIQPLPSLPGYQIESLIGRGGMGIVYRARRTKDRLVVAIKVLCSPEREGRRRFLREISISRAFRHPNLVRVLDAAPDDRQVALPWFAMEYLEGRNLEQVAADETVAEDRARAIALGIASGLAHLHRRGLVHRDIKPANVFLCDDGRVVLLDFGLVTGDDLGRMTASGDMVGTLLASAPEQIQGLPVTCATDVYQTGLTLYLLMARKQAFTLKDIVSSASGVRRREPPRLADIGPWSRSLSDVVHRCLQEYPAERFVDAMALVEALEDIGIGLLGPAELKAEVWQAADRLMQVFRKRSIDGFSGQKKAGLVSSSKGLEGNSMSDEAHAIVDAIRRGGKAVVQNPQDHGIALGLASAIARCLRLLGDVRALGGNRPLPLGLAPSQEDLVEMNHWALELFFRRCSGVRADDLLFATWGTSAWPIVNRETGVTSNTLPDDVIPRTSLLWIIEPMLSRRSDRGDVAAATICLERAIFDEGIVKPPRGNEPWQGAALLLYGFRVGWPAVFGVGHTRQAMEGARRILAFLAPPDGCSPPTEKQAFILWRLALLVLVNGCILLDESSADGSIEVEAYSKLRERVEEIATDHRDEHAQFAAWARQLDLLKAVWRPFEKPNYDDGGS